VAGGSGKALADDVAAAVTGGAEQGRWAIVVQETAADDDHAIQALAASLLDGLCSGLCRS
jgi:hypothetical protein